MSSNCDGTWNRECGLEEVHKCDFHYPMGWERKFLDCGGVADVQGLSILLVSGAQTRHFSNGVGLSAHTGICDRGGGCGGGKLAGILSMI